LDLLAWEARSNPGSVSVEPKRQAVPIRIASRRVRPSQKAGGMSIS
jgi:hypothetical protein